MTNNETGTAAVRVAVLGSINMDLVVWCAALPKPGETILADSSSEFCGGKGANQAVAAARAGGQVTMIGAVGQDAFANRLLEGLDADGIDCSSVERLPGSSGLAVIAVDGQGQNCIMVVPGANALISLEAVKRAESLIAGCDVLMLQLEIPLEMVMAASELARRHHVPVILDPAPAPTSYPPEMLQVDLLCPNENEASLLSGLPVTNLREAQAAAQWLHEAGAKNVALTLGAAGTCLVCENVCELIEPFAVQAIDSTAAGDAFAGALAVRWRQTQDLREAVQFANAAGALAAARRGAQASMATYSEIEALRKTRP